MRALIFILLAAAFWVFLGSTLQWVAALAGLFMAVLLYFYLRKGLLSAIFVRGWGGWKNPFSAVVGIILYALAVVKSNLRVARLIMDFRRPVRPAVLKVYVGEMGELEQTIVGNSITLTPGTITVDFSDDGQYIYVHVLEADDVDAARRALLAHLETHFGKGLHWWKSPST